MTPAEHVKAIEDAAFSYADAHLVLNRNPHKETLDKANAALCGLKDAIIAGVGAAPPKDSAEFALAALVAAGHVSQSKVDYARALMPEGGYKAKTVPQRWQFVKCWCEDCDVSANVLRSRVSVCPECGDKRCARAKNHANGCSAAAPKP